MLNNKKKIQIAAAVGTLLVFAFGVGCNGFFVDPVLTSLTVGPTATINQGATVQESAFGTYNDGSQGSVSNVQWSTSDSTIASISSSGLVTGVAAGGPVTITGASAAVTGTSSITVNIGNATALNITPTTGQINHSGGTATFTANATVQGQSTPENVSSTANWSVSNSTDYSISGGVVTAQSTAVAGQQITVTATYQSTNLLTATAKLTSF